MLDFKDNYFINYSNNPFFSKFNIKELFIIGSLIEKEGLDYIDKKKIYSVIINRLEKKMRLQIDATVLYSITEGKYNLGRKLTFDDLKIDHPYNTYKINGLPPKPISYVGLKTIELILEGYNTDYLYYFFNSIKNEHEFSKNFEEHKSKLNEYRNQK